MADRPPIVSVYSACRNGAPYLPATLESVLSQTFGDLELVIVDGASTDRTPDILAQYGRDARLRWTSEPDENAAHGFWRALIRTRGRYLMCLPVSDVYLPRTWIADCVERLDADPEIALVHGNVQRMTADGTALGPMHPDWLESPPPDREAYFAYWLATFSHAAEITYCVRRHVYRQCYPAYVPSGSSFDDVVGPLDDEQFDRFSPHLRFLHRFHAGGYLAAYLPVLATAARENLDNLTTSHKRYSLLEARKYVADIVRFRQRVVEAPDAHRFREGSGRPLARMPFAGTPGLAALVRAYRIHGTLMWDWSDEANLRHQARARLFHQRWRWWGERLGPGAPVAIYGGGMHTDQLLETLGPERERLRVVAILDQRPCRGESMYGIPLTQRDEFDYSGVALVIISSKCFEEEIARYLSSFLPEARIGRIYDGSPAVACASWRVTGSPGLSWGCGLEPDVTTGITTVHRRDAQTG